MSNSKVYQNDEGTLIRVNTYSDLSSATVTKIKVQKPSGASAEWNGSPNGTYVEYTTVSGDLDEVGAYVIYVYVETGSWKGHGEPDELKVWAVGT